jgi:hypothetical protein
MARRECERFSEQSKLLGHTQPRTKPSDPFFPESKIAFVIPAVGFLVSGLASMNVMPAPATDEQAAVKTADPSPGLITAISVFALWHKTSEMK